MMEEEKNCKDVISQLSASKSSIQRLMGIIISENLRSEEHTSELQSPNCISYAVFCLKKKKKKKRQKDRKNGG